MILYDEILESKDTSFYSKLLLIIYYYPHLKEYLMWNIFKLKQGATQGQKGSQEDADAVLRLLRLKFQKKMKEVSQNIAQSQNFFNSYSELTPRQQQMISTFQQMLQTLQGLISIIGELREQINHQQGEINQLVRARNMVANHHDIVNNLQQMYSQQIRVISERHEKDIQVAIEGKDELEKNIIEMSKYKSQSQQNEEKMRLKVRTLEGQIEELKAQNSSLSSQLQQLSLRSGRLLESNEKKKIINWQSLKLQYLFYYSRLKQGVIKFLDLKDYLRLKRVNRYFRAVLQKGQGRFIHYMARRQFQQKEKQALQSVKNYQRILQSFPAQNIKFNAIKYLYFRIKPASYIVSYLQDEVQSQPIVQESKDKGKFNWRSLFAGDKQKKQQQNKFSLTQLKKEQQFKKVQCKIQSLFRHILPFKLPEDLSYFSQTMQRQLSQLKESLVGKGPKGSQNAWTAELHCLCRFMYLQVNELYGLLQVLFAQLLAKTRSLSQVQEQAEELRGNETTLRNLIQDLSREKANLQRKSFLFESEVLKKSLQKDALTSNLECISIQLINLRSEHENLCNDNSSLRKLQQQLIQQRKSWQSGLNRIRKELQELEQPSQVRRRRFSSGNGDQDFEEKAGIQKF